MIFCENSWSSISGAVNAAPFFICNIFPLLRAMLKEEKTTAHHEQGRTENEQLDKTI